MYCTHCGKEIAADQNFCAHCGTPNAAQQASGPETPATSILGQCDSTPKGDPEGPAQDPAASDAFLFSAPASDTPSDHSEADGQKGTEGMFTTLLGTDSGAEQTSHDHTAAPRPEQPQAPAFSRLIEQPRATETPRYPVFAESFKRVPWGLVLLWNILTMGVYYYFWIFLRTKAVNKLQSAKQFPTFVAVFNFLLFLAYIFLSGMSGALEELGMKQELEQVDMVALPIYLLYIITFVWINFRIRRVLLDHERSHGNQGFKVFWLWTLLFSNIHLQHKINTLIDRDKTAPARPSHTATEPTAFPLIQPGGNRQSSASGTDNGFPKV